MNYFFVNSGEQDGDRGDGRMTLDLGKRIATQIGVAPVFLSGKEAAATLGADPDSFVFDLSSRNRTPLTGHISSNRIFRIHIHNHLGGVPNVSPLYDLYLSPNFNPIASAKTIGKVPVIEFNCLPSRVTPANTKQAAKDWCAQNGYAPNKPVVSLVIGSLGDNYGQDYWIRNRALITQHLTELSKNQNITVCYTTTWRTEPELNKFLKETFPLAPIGYNWNADKAPGRPHNPYLSMIGLSDWMIVQGDSISNLSDAAGARKRTYILGGHNVKKTDQLGNYMADEPWSTVRNMIDIMVKNDAAIPYCGQPLDRAWRPTVIDNWDDISRQIVSFANDKYVGCPVQNKRFSGPGLVHS